MSQHTQIPNLGFIFLNLKRMIKQTSRRYSYIYKILLERECKCMWGDRERERDKQTVLSSFPRL